MPQAGGTGWFALALAACSLSLLLFAPRLQTQINLLPKIDQRDAYHGGKAPARRVIQKVSLTELDHSTLSVKHMSQVPHESRELKRPEVL